MNMRMTERIMSALRYAEGGQHADGKDHDALTVLAHAIRSFDAEITYLEQRDKSRNAELDRHTKSIANERTVAVRYLRLNRESNELYQYIKLVDGCAVEMFRGAIISKCPGTEKFLNLVDFTDTTAAEYEAAKAKAVKPSEWIGTAGDELDKMLEAKAGKVDAPVKWCDSCGCELPFGDYQIVGAGAEDVKRYCRKCEAKAKAEAKKMHSCETCAHVDKAESDEPCCVCWDYPNHPKWEAKTMADNMQVLPESRGCYNCGNGPFRGRKCLTLDCVGEDGVTLSFANWIPSITTQHQIAPEILEAFEPWARRQIEKVFYLLKADNQRLNEIEKRINTKPAMIAKVQNEHLDPTPRHP